MPARALIVPLVVALASSAAHGASSVASFDHHYARYASVLQQHVRGSRVDYAALKANRAELDLVVASFGAMSAVDEASWPRAERLAFWINAYNVFTLRAIVDHYPIQGRWMSLYPRNSIRQIDGVWTGLKWRAAGREVTLDDIEHRILRPQFQEPRMHLAINCASIGCPPLAADPYRATSLDQQLDAATARYLASPLGLVVSGSTLRMSSIFKWFGGDFEARYGPEGPASRTGTDRALLGLVMEHGPVNARTIAGGGKARITFLDYDWSLNDVADATSR